MRHSASMSLQLQCWPKATLCLQRAVSVWWHWLPSIGILNIKIRRSHGHLIYIMKIPLPKKMVFILRWGPDISSCWLVIMCRHIWKRAKKDRECCPPGPCFNIKTIFSSHVDSHVDARSLYWLDDIVVLRQPPGAETGKNGTMQWLLKPWLLVSPCH